MSRSVVEQIFSAHSETPSGRLEGSETPPAASATARADLGSGAGRGNAAPAARRCELWSQEHVQHARDSDGLDRNQAAASVDAGIAGGCGGAIDAKKLPDAHPLCR
eukprot:CAMPEP_0179838032 /NCGR_PEP_ID=MMETSP0982-20121206/420_1 /TAXON_ID=483367 /ORGANISM="non described non described, Strain CCMP 2436" /LENGTH=105 /DNA_ID=CAMNT_0021721297 /DNA_START=437 /DNA_END=752 /DNA_ORIENTATION=+